MTTSDKNRPGARAKAKAYALIDRAFPLDPPAATVTREPPVVTPAEAMARELEEWARTVPPGEPVSDIFTRAAATLREQARGLAALRDGAKGWQEIFETGNAHFADLAEAIGVMGPECCGHDEIIAKARTALEDTFARGSDHAERLNERYIATARTEAAREMREAARLAAWAWTNPVACGRNEPAQVAEYIASAIDALPLPGGDGKGNR